jgi:hypothetical protein
VENEAERGSEKIETEAKIEKKNTQINLDNETMPGKMKR